MTLTIPIWLLWTAAVILGVPALIIIAFCVAFTFAVGTRWK